MNKISYIIILITLLSCQSQDYDFERTVIVVENQKFEILTANKIFDTFLSRKSNYTNHVYKQIEQEFKDNAEFASLIEILKTEIEPNGKLKEQMDIFRNIDFIQIIESTYQRVVEELCGTDIKILFVPSNPAYKEIWETYGVAFHAITPGAGKIIVSINPTIKNWQQLLPYALAHEYHHCVWISRNFERSDLTPLEYLILEGRADAFAMELFPDNAHPFLNVLSKEQEKRVWNIIKPELYVRGSELNDKIMSGTRDIPTGSVYSIGYSIIESFKINNPKISDKELIDMAPEEILELSNYDN